MFLALAGADQELIRGLYTDFGGCQFGPPNSRLVEKENLTFVIKIKKLQSVTRFS